jgi:Putative glycolipid-binding
MAARLAWVGDGAQRMEVAHVERTEPEFVASGTQLGLVYELRYQLKDAALHLELVGERIVEIGLNGADFFDLGWSPLFNSLPVVRDQLLEPGPPRDYLMRWVEVPSLEVSMSKQRYEPLGDGVVRFRAGDFVSDITFDTEAFVVNYPGIGARRYRGENHRGSGG